MPRRILTVSPLLALVLAGCGATTGRAQPAPDAQAEPAAIAEPVQSAVKGLAHVEVMGTGQTPIVLIPHLGLGWDQYKDFMERNADRYTMYAVTLAGFGGSEAPAMEDPASWAEAPRLRAAEQAILRLIDERNIDQPVILGHALGGHLAWRLLAENPQHFRAAVIVDGLPAYPLGEAGEDPAQRARIVDTDFATQALTMSEAAWRQQWRFLLGTMIQDANRAAAIAGEFIDVPRDTTAKYYLEMIAGDVREGLKTLDVPTLVIAAVPEDAGQTMPIEERRRMWRRIVDDVPSARLVFFENTGQFITEDAPERLDIAVAQFLQGVEHDRSAEPGE